MPTDTGHPSRLTTTPSKPGQSRHIVRTLPSKTVGRSTSSTSRVQLRPAVGATTPRTYVVPGSSNVSPSKQLTGDTTMAPPDDRLHPRRVGLEIPHVRHGSEDRQPLRHDSLLAGASRGLPSPTPTPKSSDRGARVARAAAASTSVRDVSAIDGRSDGSCSYRDHPAPIADTRAGASGSPRGRASTSASPGSSITTAHTPGRTMFGAVTLSTTSRTAAPANASWMVRPPPLRRLRRCRSPPRGSRRRDRPPDPARRSARSSGTGVVVGVIVDVGSGVGVGAGVGESARPDRSVRDRGHRRSAGRRRPHRNPRSTRRSDETCSKSRHRHSRRRRCSTRDARRARRPGTSPEGAREPSRSFARAVTFHSVERGHARAPRTAPRTTTNSIEPSCAHERRADGRASDPSMAWNDVIAGPATRVQVVHATGCRALRPRSCSNPPRPRRRPPRRCSLT